MSTSPITPPSRNTWAYIEKHVEGIELERIGRSVLVRMSGRELKLPPYPEVNAVRLVRRDNIIIPDVPDDWVAEWKANGSNIRIYSIDGEILALTRGGFLLDWKPYISLVESPLKDKLVAATEDGRFLLFGELVGPRSLTRICPDYWRKYIGGEIGYLLFDVYDMEKGVFISLENVRRLAERHGIMTVPTEEIIPDRLMMRMEEFLGVCGGEVWEGFVFKNVERGTVGEVAKNTLKWRLDETREYAARVYMRRYRDPLSWKIYQALRKFVVEGYLDPPVTVGEAPDEAWDARNIILTVLDKVEDGEIPRDKADRTVKDRLYSLTERLLSQRVKRDRWYKKARSMAIKIFRKLHIFTY